ncbi:Ankyrin repeat domain-containing protein 50 [Fusarium oxysporum f. sp. rapae]|uniref:Ankyrin repeat domain-containing protein 50 n=1 Tax=Fusarium oxysporum f. sp. rapae TaxID=485398 RepID=A0A8J5PHK3_FUSOX|nr:Ankyrin repeat domain-containing protein 50 [Fusarium oxysporum f. sp. rapae]
MEPVGLAVGLVGLFSTCMKVMQRIDSYKIAGRDLRQLDAQLNATMHIFERWEAVLLTEYMEELPVEEIPDCVDQDYVESMILELCGSLIEVWHVPSSESIPERICKSEEDFVGEQKVHLSHFSQGIPSPQDLSRRWHITFQREAPFPEAWDNFFDDDQQAKWRFISYAAKECPFVLAIYCDLKDTVTHLIHEGNYDVEDRSFWNLTPLAWACFFYNKDIIQLLLDNGADCNAIFKGGRTLLHRSVEVEEATGILLAHGANLMAVDDQRLTQLCAAALAGNLTATKQLLDKGADISHVAADGATPLSEACGSGHLHIAKFLIEKGADVNQKATNGYTAFNLAVWNNWPSIVELLIDEGAHIKSIHVRGTEISLLTMAAGRGHFEVVKVLIAKGAAPNESLPILVAACHGYYESFANILDLETISRPPEFDYSCYGDIVELLLQSGADVNARDEGGCTPLHGATYNNLNEVMHLILANGADTNAKEFRGRTPLHISANERHLTKTQLLLEYGADVAARDRAGRIPLHYACRTGGTEVVKFLIQTSHETINDSDLWGSTPLSIAARLGHVAIVRALLGTKAVNADTCDIFGRKAVWWAIDQDHDEVTSLLDGKESKDLEADAEETGMPTS